MLASRTKRSFAIRRKSPNAPHPSLFAIPLTDSPSCILYYHSRLPYRHRCLPRHWMPRGLSLETLPFAEAVNNPPSKNEKTSPPPPPFFAIIGAAALHRRRLLPRRRPSPTPPSPSPSPELHHPWMTGPAKEKPQNPSHYFYLIMVHMQSIDRMAHRLAYKPQTAWSTDQSIDLVHRSQKKKKKRISYLVFGLQVATWSFQGHFINGTIS